MTARLRILELPLDTSGETATTPFALVFDRLDETEAEAITDSLEAFKTETGATTVMAFPFPVALDTDEASAEGSPDAPIPGTIAYEPLETRPRLAKDYDLTSRFLTVDGEQFPWHIAADGPRVEPCDNEYPMHILWVPVLINKAIPTYAHDTPGEPVSTEPEIHVGQTWRVKGHRDLITVVNTHHIGAGSGFHFVSFKTQFGDIHMCSERSFREAYELHSEQES